MGNERSDKPPESPAPNLSNALLMLRVFQVLAALAGIACIVAAFGAFLVYQHVTLPGTPGEKTPVTVPEGVTGIQAGAILVDSGLLEHELFFRMAIRLDKSGKPIKHGLYVLTRGSSAMELLHTLQDGPNRYAGPGEIAPELKVTIPEGLSIAQAAGLFDDPEAFVEAASDPGLIARLGIEAETLEGFLMPDTYYFDEKPTEREVVERMAGQFETAYAALVAECDVPDGLDTMAVVALASLVEEEARYPDERPSIAAVIHNRLAKGMLLQMDSSIQYALGKYGERLLYEDLDTDSPYNTYIHKGLPPGPISSPGIASLRAALSPADVDYLFFVSNADGLTHTFSSNEAEHFKAVSRFRKSIAQQRREEGREN